MEMLRRVRGSLGALDGAFSTALIEPTPSSSAPPTVLPDIISRRRERCSQALERAVRDHGGRIAAAVDATGTALDESAQTTIQQSVMDLRDLLRLQDVHVVYMRPGATDTDLQTALLELGVIRPPAPAPRAPPPATRRRRRAGVYAV